MSALEYVRTKAVALAVTAVGIAAACLIASVCGCPPDAVVLMAAVLALCAAVALVYDHLRSKRYYSQLQELAAGLQHPYQLHSFLSQPDSPDQAIVHEALQTMGAASTAEVVKAQAKADEHREFVESWIHGVKVPLAACELISQRVSQPERSQLASEMDKIGHKIDAALWYARSDSANNDYAIREVALADIPREACRDNARFLIERGCIPQIDVDDDVVVFTDKKQAAFIVSQLVENAAKYGARHLRFTAQRSNTQNGTGHIALQVEDDGRGIPATDINRVFERGFTGTRGREGEASTGMGLYLAARLCEQLGLGLSISSADGEGTCATVAFPLDRRRMDAQRDKSVSQA